MVCVWGGGQPGDVSLAQTMLNEAAIAVACRARSRAHITVLACVSSRADDGVELLAQERITGGDWRGGNVVWTWGSQLAFHLEVFSLQARDDQASRAVSVPTLS